MSQQRATNLFQYTVECLRAADVETDEDGVRVWIGERPHVVVVRRSWNKRKHQTETHSHNIQIQFCLVFEAVRQGRGHTNAVHTFHPCEFKNRPAGKTSVPHLMTDSVCCWTLFWCNLNRDPAPGTQGKTLPFVICRQKLGKLCDKAWLAQVFQYENISTGRHSELHCKTCIEVRGSNQNNREPQTNILESMNMKLKHFWQLFSYGMAAAKP